MQFSEEKAPGFHQILKGASGPKVIKDPALVFQFEKMMFLLY